MASSSGMIRRGIRLPPAPTDKDRDRASLNFERESTMQTRYTEAAGFRAGEGGPSASGFDPVGAELWDSSARADRNRWPRGTIAGVIAAGGVISASLVVQVFE